MSQKEQPTKLSIELPNDLGTAYANFSLISHTHSEVVLDFAAIMPNTPKAKIAARVVMTPANAKLLHRALSENLAKFEARYGEIKLPEQQPGIFIDPNKGFSG